MEPQQWLSAFSLDLTWMLRRAWVASGNWRVSLLKGNNCYCCIFMEYCVFCNLLCLPVIMYKMSLNFYNEGLYIYAQSENITPVQLQLPNTGTGRRSCGGLSSPRCWTYPPALPSPASLNSSKKSWPPSLRKACTRSSMWKSNSFSPWWFKRTEEESVADYRVI